jgi:lysophospholipase L1-like esterase
VRQRLRARLAGVLATMLVGAGLAVLPSGSALADTIPPTNYSPVTLTGVTGGLALTHPDGGVTTVCNSNTNALRSFSAAGLEVQDFNPTSPHYVDTCNGNALLGQDGTVYVAAWLDDYTPAIQAYKNDAVVWTHPLGCGRYHRVNAMTLGVDGNLYLVTVEGNNGSGCSSSRLIGLSAAPVTGTTAPQVLVNQSVAGYIIPGGVAAYEDGLALIRQSSVQYVEYDGTAASPLEAGAWAAAYQETQGAVVSNGRVFLPIAATNTETSSCTGSTWGMVSGIAAYEPSGEVWTFPLPACSIVNEVRPTPSGGVVFRRYSQSNATSEIVMLNVAGTLLWRYSMDKPSNDFSYWGVGFSVDLNGNVAVQENLRYQVVLGWSTYHFPAVRFKLLGGNSGNVLKSFELRGDNNATDSNGYTAIEVYSGIMNARTTADTVYLTVRHCTHFSNCQGDTRLYAVEMPGVQMDYPRGAILGEEGAKPYVMAVAGDSFSAGIGSRSEGQGYLEDNCWRSPNAYGPRLAEDPRVALKLTNSSFVACSGATTAAITSPYKGEFAQASMIPSNAKAVFLTIGGNDAKFSRLGALCIFIDCAATTYQTEFDGYLSTLQAKLVTSYEEVLEQAPGATVYVVGYPHILPLDDCENAGGGVWWGLLAGLQADELSHPVFASYASDAGLTFSEATSAEMLTPITISTAEAQFVATFENELNLVISDAVDEVDEQRLVFVSATALGSPLAGHQLCSEAPFFNGLDGAAQGNTFHPNAAGQAALAELAREALEDHQPQYVLAG